MTTAMRDPNEQHDPGSPASRYARQIAYRNLGPEAQRRLARSRVVLIGCGAMGGMQANILARAGVGCLRIIDRDAPELDNLHRQILYDERDVAERIPKAQAAAAKLRRANSDITIEAEVAQVDGGNVERLIGTADLLLDGTDNLETRYIINDAAVKLGIPWVYGGVVADYGNVMPIVPGRTPCLRCLFPDPPDPSEMDTCQTVGVLTSAVGVIASLQTVEAIKILTGQLDALNHQLHTIDVWTGRFEAVPAGPDQRRADCPCCGLRRFEFLTHR